MIEYGIINNQPVGVVVSFPSVVLNKNGLNSMYI